MVKSEAGPELCDAAVAPWAASPGKARRLWSPCARASRAGGRGVALLGLLAMVGSTANAMVPDEHRERKAAANGKIGARVAATGHGAAVPLVTWLTFQDQHDADPARLGADRFTALPVDPTESITVYGKRKAGAAGWNGDDAPIAFGGVTMTGSQDTGLPGVSGLTIRASKPLSIVPGLDMELNVTGGHEQINDSSTVPTAAVVVGLRLHF